MVELRATGLVYRHRPCYLPYSGKRLGCTDFTPVGIRNQTRSPCPQSSAMPISPLNKLALSLRETITDLHLRTSVNAACG